MTLTTAMGGRAQKEKAVRLVGKKGRCLVVGGGIYIWLGTDWKLEFRVRLIES